MGAKVYSLENVLTSFKKVLEIGVYEVGGCFVISFSLHQAAKTNRKLYISHWNLFQKKSLCGPVAQSGQSGGLLIRRPRVQFPSGPL
jgi:hypothetical protein